MPHIVSIILPPEEAFDEAIIAQKAAVAAKTDLSAVKKVQIVKRSVDARQKNIKINITANIIEEKDNQMPVLPPFRANNVSQQREVLIIGAGPAGLFAALRLIELNLRPVILERGKDVSERKKDIALISREQLLNPDSNYCFGEGGAGTFSDGKLYTRSKKRGDNRRLLELLCLHGANENILYEAHPHIGSDKLPIIVSNIRKTIIDAGGEILFNKKVTQLKINHSHICSATVNGNENYTANDIILASGHSADDIYNMLHEEGIAMEIKPFAMGLRVEHPQELINAIRYHGKCYDGILPAASYNIVKQVEGRGVYSFCMCPGGFIVPAATNPDSVVVNGMSPSQHNSPFANSGIVVEIRINDIPSVAKYGVLAGLAYRRDIEQKARQHGGDSQRAPAQRLTDFVSGRYSNNLPKVSYMPGVTSSPIHEWLPPAIGDRLRKGFKMFEASMRGFLTGDAVVTGVESRTSSPVRIPRNNDTLEHISISGLYPAGEGSGYAGGIISSAVDGTLVAEKIAGKYSR